MWDEGTVTDQARMEYIDSQLAKQRASSQASNTHLPGTPSASTTCPPSSTNNSSLTLTKPVTELNRQPAALGKLQEVDLGDTTRWRNEEQTRRKIAGEKSLEEEEMELAKAAKAPKKVRLGPDGKPWRSRRRRRGSDDIERDRIVEEVMRENRRAFILSLSHTLFLFYFLALTDLIISQWKSTTLLHEIVQQQTM